MTEVAHEQYPCHCHICGGCKSYRNWVTSKDLSLPHCKCSIEEFMAAREKWRAERKLLKTYLDPLHQPIERAGAPGSFQ